MAAKGFLTMKLDGFEAVSRGFNSLPYAVQGKVIRPALRAGARVILPRAKALAPRRSGRLADGKWTIRAASGRKNFVGVRLEVPRRGELGIPGDAKGFYPFSQEFGWRTGTAVHGPLDLGAKGWRKRKNGTVYWGFAAGARGRARELLNAQRRKIPGKRFMRTALLASRSEVLATVGAQMTIRMGEISPEVLRQAQSDLAAAGAA